MEEVSEPQRRRSRQRLSTWRRCHEGRGLGWQYGNRKVLGFRISSGGRVEGPVGEFHGGT